MIEFRDSVAVATAVATPSEPIEQSSRQLAMSKANDLSLLLCKSIDNNMNKADAERELDDLVNNICGWVRQWAFGELHRRYEHESNVELPNFEGMK